MAAIFILVAIDEGPGGSNIKYQFNEINKLHSVISILVRCCDCTEKCVSSTPVSTCIEKIKTKLSSKSTITLLQMLFVLHLDSNSKWDIKCKIEWLNHNFVLYQGKFENWS